MIKKSLIFALIILSAIVLFSLTDNNKKDALEQNVEEVSSEEISLEDPSGSKMLSQEVLTKIKAVLPEDGFATGFDDLPLLTWQEEVIAKEEEKTSIDIKYPKFNGTDDQVKQLNTYIKDYVDEALEGAESGIGSFDLYEVSLTISYTVVGVKDGVVGVEMVTADYSGGGNGNHRWPTAINWDLKSNKIMTISEMLCRQDSLQKVMSVGETQLLKDFANNSNMASELPESTINDIKDAENWDVIIVGSDELIVVFPPYRIVGGSLGTIRVVVPYSSVPEATCL